MSRLSFDPQLLPIESIAGEAPPPPERLTAEGLRRLFLAQPPWTPEAVEERRPDDAREAIPAAVLMPIVDHGSGLALLLTYRAPHLYDHAGQVSLPGGRAESADRDAVATALRETQEEIGLDPRHVEVLGVLPDYFTISGYRVTPVVGLVKPPFTLEADDFEVAEIFEVPLDHLMNGGNHERRVYQLPDADVRRWFYSMPYGRHFIWGATAGMLRNLFHFLRA